MTHRPVTTYSPTSSEFHRRRAERELGRALDAVSPDTALRHLELARLHHHQRMTGDQSRAIRGDVPIFRTDKEA